MVNHGYYHIYNRGVDKREVFSGSADYKRFLLSLFLMNDEVDGLMIRWRNFFASHPNSSPQEFLRLNLSERKELVNVIAYCCNPNHYHFVLRQLRERGIERFMQRVATGYTMYYNEKYHRTGALFQGRFKSSPIKSEGSLLRMSIYVSCNSEIHRLSQAESYPWCSFRQHIGKAKDDFINDKDFRSQFRNVAEFKEYAKENIIDFQTRKQDADIFFE